MLVTRGISVVRLLKWAGPQFLMLLLLAGGVGALYKFEVITFALPWLPISVIGTAVAFYVGFKNSQSYDRMWIADHGE